MRLFSKVDVGGGLSDFWAYIREPRPHRWALWGVAAALTWLVFSSLAQYIIRKEPPQSRIVYFENWSEGRSIDESRSEWVDRAKEVNRRHAARRAEYQKLADMLGVDYDSTEADKVTRETLGAEADTIGKRPEQKRSTLAERAARGPQPATPPAKSAD